MSQCVFLVWEQGSNLGHVSRLRTLARLVEQAGGQPVLFVPPASVNTPALRATGWAVHAVPQCLPTGRADRSAPLSFADILRRLGFGDAAGLSAAVAQWRVWIDRYQPRTIVLDYAPIAQLAAMMAGLNAVQVNNGFAAPPSACPLFERGLRGPYLQAKHASHLAQVNRSIELTAQHHAGPRDASLTQLLAYPAQVFDSAREVDPYGPREVGLHIDPLSDTQHPLLAWPDDGGPLRVVAYLRHAPQAGVILDHLLSRQASVVCIWPDAPAGEQARYHGSRVHIRSDPVQLPPLFAQAQFCLNYAGSGTTSTALFSGLPQLLLPYDMEKWMMAQRLAQQGLAIALEPRAQRAKLLNAVDHMIDDSAMRQRAQSVKARYAGINWAARRQQMAQAFVRGQRLEQWSASSPAPAASLLGGARVPCTPRQAAL